MIKVNSLWHSYGNNETYAVKDVSFEVEKGEVLGFLGPSGAGKSTTQGILTGLLPLQKGEAVIAGFDVKKPSAEMFNKIGVSFEQPNVYGKLTALENLEFFSRLYDVPTQDPMQLLKMVGLEQDAKKKASDFSKGMKHRLVFARSMLNNPEIWFLDEPTAGLDPTTANNIKEIIRERNKNGATIFLTTHNMFVADELCSRVAFINDGEIILIDSPRNLKLKYGEKLVTVEYRKEGKLLNKTFSLVNEAERMELGQLIESGNLETMHTKEATLEEIFIQVTGRGLK